MLGPMFWLSISLHLFCLFIDGQLPIYIHNASTGEDEIWQAADLPPLDWRAAIVGLTLLFFFIVFYGNASYARFYHLYGHCVGIGGTTMEWVALIKAHSGGLPEPERAGAQWNAVRFVLAAPMQPPHHLG